MANKELNIVVKVTDQATKQLQKVQWQVEDFANRNKATFQKMALWGSAAFAGIAVFAKKWVMALSDYEESINAVNVMFWESSKAVQDFAQVSAKEIWLSKTEFQQLSVWVWALLKNAWAWTEELGDKTIELAKRASDMASVFNTSVPDAMSALNQALRWEAEAIRAYWWDVTDATMQTYLLSQGINKKTTELSQAEKTMYRYDMIMSQTAVTTWDFKNTSDGLANSLRIQEALAKDTAISIWQWLAPALDSARAVIEPLLARLFERINANPMLSWQIVLIWWAITGLVAVLWTLGLVLPTIIAWITLLLSPIWLAVIAIWWLIAVGVLLYKNRDEIKQKAVDIWTGISNFFTNWREWLSENTQTGIRVVAWIITFWFSEIIIATIQNRDKIKETISQARQAIVWFFTKYQDEILTVLRVFMWVMTAWLSEWFIRIVKNWDEVWATVKQVLSVARDVIVAIVEWWFTAIWWVFNNWRDFLVWIAQSIGDSISGIFSSSFDFIMDKAAEVFDRVWNKINNIMSYVQKARDAISSIWWWGWWGIDWARANWWPVSANWTYLVGERWPELFVPSSSWSIVPNEKMWWWVTINMWGVQVSNQADENRLVEKMKQMLVRETQLYNYWIT